GVLRLMQPDVVKDVARYMPGAHELIPSRAYADQLRGTNWGDFPFGEDGWNFNGKKGIERIYSFDELAEIMNAHSPDGVILPGTNTDLFHNKPYLGQRLQDNWSGDQTRVTYYNFVGRCLNKLGQNNTIGSVIATDEWYKDWLGIWRESKH